MESLMPGASAGMAYSAGSWLRWLGLSLLWVLTRPTCIAGLPQGASLFLWISWTSLYVVEFPSVQK